MRARIACARRCQGSRGRLRIDACHGGVLGAIAAARPLGAAGLTGAPNTVAHGYAGNHSSRRQDPLQVRQPGRGPRAGIQPERAGRHLWRDRVYPHAPAARHRRGARLDEGRVRARRACELSLCVLTDRSGALSQDQLQPAGCSHVHEERADGHAVLSARRGTHRSGPHRCTVQTAESTFKSMTLSPHTAVRRPSLYFHGDGARVA
jgi:hypothetical protein